MPTTRPRYTVTETDELKRALDEVARSHPELAGDRNALFRRLVSEATDHYDQERTDRLERMRTAMRRIETRELRYPPDYLAELRAEWPE
jgi:hypothetical protein